MTKKVELLKTLVIEMGNKMIKLEAEIKIIKSDKNELMVKTDKETEDKTQVQNKPNPDVKDPTVTEHKKLIVNESDREMPKLVQSSFKCQVCGAIFKKEVTKEAL